MDIIPLKKVLKIAKSGVELFEGKKVYIDTRSVKGNRIVGDGKKVTYNNRKSRANMEVNNGDVLFAKMANTKKVLFIDSENSSKLYSTGFFVLRPNLELLRPKFLYYYFRFNGTELLKDRLAHGETQKQLNNSQLRKRFLIHQYDFRDQDKFISTFEKIDSILNRLQKQRDHAYNLLMAEREKSYDSNPKVSLPLEQVVKTPPYRYPTFYGFKYVKEGVPVLKISNMTSDAKFPKERTVYDHITEEINQEYPKTIVEENDIIMEARGTYIGKCALVPTELAESNISPNTIRISLDTTMILPSYFWHYTFTSKWKSQIQKRTRYWKLKFGTIRADKLNRVQIPVPPKKEQEKIADKLQLLDLVNIQFQNDSEQCEKIFQSYLKKVFGIKQTLIVK